MKSKIWVVLTVSVLLAFATLARAGQAPGQRYAKGTAVTPMAMVPGTPVNLTMAGGTSQGTTLSTPGAFVRIICTVTANVRFTTGASTAVSTDNILPANTPWEPTLPSNIDTVTFYTASAGTCQVAVKQGAP